MKKFLFWLIPASFMAYIVFTGNNQYQNVAEVYFMLLISLCLVVCPLFFILIKVTEFVINEHDGIDGLSEGTKKNITDVINIFEGVAILNHGMKKYLSFIRSVIDLSLMLALGWVWIPALYVVATVFDRLAISSADKLCTKYA